MDGNMKEPHPLTITKVHSTDTSAVCKMKEEMYLNMRKSECETAPTFRAFVVFPIFYYNK